MASAVAPSVGPLDPSAAQAAPAADAAFAKAPAADAASALSPAPADAASAPPPAPGAPRSLALVTAFFPGLALGHWVAGDPQTMWTLLAVEGAGVLAMGAGLGALVATGASRKLVAPSAGLVIFGAGLFAASWLADVYGVAAPRRGTGAPRTDLPAIETSVGYRHVVDPVFAYRSFLAMAFDLRLGALRLRPEGWFGAGHANERVRFAAAWRFAGPRPATLAGAPPAPSRDGSFLDLELAGVRHAFPPERFAITSLELLLSGRLDLARLLRSLEGSFVEGSIGGALARHAYDAPGEPVGAAEQLLARWAYGLYAGRPGSPVRGEASVFYEHRHDGFAAGAKLPGLGSGVPGSVGLRGLAWLSSELGALAEIQAGSAWVFGASLLLRQPVRP